MKKRLVLLGICLAMVVCFAACNKETKQETYPVELYYVSQDYVLTGDETGEVMVEYKGQSVTCDEGSGHQYIEAIKLLYTVPEGMEDKLTTGVRKAKSVRVENEIAYIDFDDSNIAGGSLEETMLVSQVVETLTESFDEIEEVQFLVNGQKVETLMGHLSTAEPFSDGLLETDDD